MKMSDHKGFSLVVDHESPNPTISYWLSEIIYHPSRKFFVTVGFAMFEARDQDRLIAVRFAPNLELVECFSIALGREPLKDMLSRATPKIEYLIASAPGIEPLLFPQEFGIPDELRFLPPRKFQAESFNEEVERLYPAFFSELNSFSERYECRKRKTYGYNFLRQSPRKAFIQIWRHKELEKQISVARFIPGGTSLRSIYLGYKSAPHKLFRMLQPISIVASIEAANILASNWPNIRDGLQNELGMTCEMRAVVETLSRASTVANKARDLMQDAGIVVESASANPALAKHALEALR